MTHLNSKLNIHKTVQKHFVHLLQNLKKWKSKTSGSSGNKPQQQLCYFKGDLPVKVIIIVQLISITAAAGSRAKEGREVLFLNCQ